MNKKDEILTRLVKEGHITLEEAVLLREQQVVVQPIHIPSDPYKTNPCPVAPYEQPWRQLPDTYPNPFWYQTSPNEIYIGTSKTYTIS